jgi:ABC-type Zn2+ transport system substrate-binding protein/surface adhesin
MGSTQAQEEPLNVVVTIGMIGDVVKNVAAECANVTTIMGPGVDPHLYQASSGDVQTFQDADIIFYSGYSLEGHLARFSHVSENRYPLSLSRQSPSPRRNSLRRKVSTVLIPTLDGREPLVEACADDSGCAR